MMHFQTLCIRQHIHAGVKTSLFFVAENFVILWKRMKDNAIMAMGETVLVENERINVEINKDGPNKGSTLVIPLAEEKDAGQYVCQMANGEQKKLKHTVQIRGKNCQKILKAR